MGVFFGVRGRPVSTPFLSPRHPRSNRYSRYQKEISGEEVAGTRGVSLGLHGPQEVVGRTVLSTR